MTTRLGLERFLENPPAWLKGQRIGLVVSASSTDSRLVSTIDRLQASEAFHLTALFGPEHGLRGAAQAGETVAGATDRVTGLPIYSLYGDTKKPSPEMLNTVDAFVIDLQDGGARFYTYLYTMAYVMQAAAAHDMPVIVLDRPTPIDGLTVEGPVLEPYYASFVGLYPIPNRYGLTIGECAQLFNTTFGIGCDLTVIPMEGWTRGMWFDETGLPFLPPSPNLPTLSALTVYPGTCWFEGTNLSEGRGTTKPFEYIGAPWIDDPEALAAALNAREHPGVRFRPVYFTPTFSKHEGTPCQGVQLYVMDRATFSPVATALDMLDLIKHIYPQAFEWRMPWTPNGRYPIDLLSGGSQVREHLDANRPPSELVASWQPGLTAYQASRTAALIYQA